MNKKTAYGFIVWFVVTLFVVYSFCLNTAAAVFSGAIKNTLHADNIGVALAVGAFIVGFALMQIPAGYLLDKYNAKFVVGGGVLLLALGNILISFSDNLVLFSLSNLLQGFGASFAFIAAGVLISQWFAPKLFPILFGLTQTISCVLSGIIHYIFTLLLNNHSWNEIYLYLAGFGLALFLLTVVLVRSPTDYERVKNISLKNSLRTVVGNSQIWLCAVAAAFSFGALLAYASFWYLRVEQFYGTENLQAMIISGMIFIGIGIGTPLLGWYSNVLKSRKTVIHSSLVLGTMALLLGLYLPHFNIDTLIIIKIISFLIGFLLSGSMLFYTMVSEISSAKTRGVALSVTNTMVFLFNSLMMFIPYLFITKASLMFFTYLWVLPFCVMLSILLVYFIRETYPAH